MENADPIPPALQRIVQWSCIESTPIRRVELAQVGRMWRKPHAKPLSFTAQQWIESSRSAFCWHGKFPILPGCSLHVTDAFENGQGRLEGRLWGRLRLFRRTGPEIDRGEVFRYLAELPWNPAAYTANETLTWEQTGNNDLQVSCELNGRTVQVDYHIDHAGRVKSVRATDRPCEVRGSYVDRAWIGWFDNWDEIEGIVVPREAEVAWETPEGPFTYWSGKLVAYRGE